MTHDVLGELELSDGHPFDAIAKVGYGSREIKLGIDRDEQPFEVVVTFAAEVVGRLDELDQLAKGQATRGLREGFTAGWNEYGKAQEDGTLKAGFGPDLSEAEFETRLTLNAVNVTGDHTVHFYYDEEGLFWGHGIVVAFEGVDFREARVEVVGS